MGQRKTITLAFIVLGTGFGSGFILRPIIAPVAHSSNAAQVMLAQNSVAAEPRGTQYFVKHIEEARRVEAVCRDGSMRGGECATANEAIIKVDATQRGKRFLGN